MMRATGGEGVSVLPASADCVLATAALTVPQAPAAGGEAATPVPFKLATPDTPLIVLETRVNGQGPFRFILDTGAGLTMISPELANKLDLKKEESQKGLGAGGSVDIQPGTVKSIAVGATYLDDLQVGIMDLTAVSKACETDLDGIVGFNFLSKFRVAIDYPKQTVTFE